MTEEQIQPYQFLDIYAKYNRLSTFVSIRDNPNLKGLGHLVFYQTAGGGPIEGYLGFPEKNWLNKPFRVYKNGWDDPWNKEECDEVAFFVWMRDGVNPDLQPYVCLMDSEIVKQHLVEEFCLASEWFQNHLQEEQQAGTRPYLYEDLKEEIEANRQAALYFTMPHSSLYSFITHHHRSELLGQKAASMLNNCMEKIIQRVIKKLPLHPEDA